MENDSPVFKCALYTGTRGSPRYPKEGGDIESEITAFSISDLDAVGLEGRALIFKLDYKRLQDERSCEVGGKHLSCHQPMWRHEPF